MAKRLVRTADSKTEKVTNELKNTDEETVFQIAEMLGLKMINGIYPNDEDSLDNALVDMFMASNTPMADAFKAGIQTEHYDSDDKWIIASVGYIHSTNSIKHIIDYYDLAKEVIDTPEIHDRLPENIKAIVKD